METFYQQAVHRYKDFKDKQLHQYITRKLTALCQHYRPKPSSMESVDNENIDGEEGDIDIDGGDAVNSTCEQQATTTFVYCSLIPCEDLNKLGRKLCS